MEIEIRCLGRLQVRSGTRGTHEIGPTRAGEILAHLALAQDGVRTRAQLITTLWPDLEEQRARRRLRQGLWELKRSDGVPVRSEGDSVVLGGPSPLWIDVHAFERAAGTDERERLAHAVELYRGDLLEGWLQEWILPERRRLRELAVQALARLLRREEANGRRRAALDHAHRRARLAPLDEAAHQDVMRLCAVLERWNEGLRQAEVCREVLRHELDLAPSAATESLRRHLLDGRDRVASVPAAAPAGGPGPIEEGRSLVGRASERRTLIAAAEETLAGRGRVAFVEGTAGIGKTRLLSELAEDARWRGLRVLWGQGHESARGEPYGILKHALRSETSTARLRRLRERMPEGWWRRLAPIMPVEGAFADEVARAPDDDRLGDAPPGRLREAVAGMLRAFAELQPMLFVVDDAQWADPATMHALGALVRQTPPAPATVVLAYRGGEARRRSPTWRAVKNLDAQAPGAPIRIELGPLTADATLHLVQAELGAADAVAPLASWLHDRTGGHPLFLVEALRSLRRAGAIGEETDTWTLPRSRAEADSRMGRALAASEAVESLVRRQRRQLPRPARRLLDVLSVAAAPCDGATLEAIAHSPGEPLYAALEELLRWGLVREEANGWRLTHDLLRRAAYRSVHAGRRRELHGRIADAWAREGTAPDQVVAVHLARSRRWREAADTYRRAARDAADLGAYDEALAHVREASRAAHRAGLDGAARFGLLAMEENVLHVLARREEQSRTLAMLAARASDQAQWLEVHLRRARAWVRTGHPDAAMAEAAQARTLVEALEDPSHRARTLDTVGLVAYEAGRAQEALPALERAVAAYDAQGEALGAAAALRRLGAVQAELQAFAHAERSLMRARETYRRLGDLHGEAEVEGRLGIVQRQQGRGEEAERSYRRALERFREAGDRWSTAQTATNLGLLVNARGRVADALAWLDTAISLAGEIGERRGEAIARANAASIRQALVGEHDAARAGAEAALDALATLGDARLRPLAALVLANVEVDGGDSAAGVTGLEAALADAGAVGHRWLAAQAHRDLARAYLLQEDAGAALRHAEEGSSLADSLGLATLGIELRALRGRALLALGDVDGALHETDAAMRVPRTGVNRAYLIPFARHQVSVVAGRHDEAGRTIREAREMLGAALRGLEPERVRRSLQRVPEHRELVQAYRRWWPEYRDMDLPRAAGHGSRPARGRLRLRWTVSEPADLRVADPRARRRRRVARLVRQARAEGAVPTVAALAEAVQVSRSTVKRDLARLRGSEGGTAVHDVFES